MSKIAVVGCDASGKTVFVSALTDYYKAGQRIGQSCALIPADTATRKYTDKLHHTMRIQHQWPAATVTSSAEGMRKMKWTMMKDSRPLTDIEMLDYGGENFRYAFRDDGSTRNAAVVEILVNYIAEADFIVITVGLDNMVRKLTPEIYRTLEDGEEAYQLDSEAQWITNGLLKLVKAKLEANPPGVVVALTQADKHRETLNEYGGAKALFAKCWADIDMMYPNLNVVAVASVDKLTAGGFPAEDYKTDGVLTVMKEFSRYAFGDCDKVSTRLQSLTNRLSNMTDVRTPNDFHETVRQFESAMRELHDKTAIVQELYKEDFRRHERFLASCRLFAETINETELRNLETQVSDDYWNEQLRQFPEMEGTIRGFARYYQRKADQIRAEKQRKEQDRRRAEEYRQRQLQLQEEECRQQRLAALKQEEDERRKIELQRLRAEEEKARIERERVERRDKTKSFMLKASIIVFALLLIGTGFCAWHLIEKERQNRANAELEASRRAEREAIAKNTAKEQAERAKADAQAAAARQREAEAKARQAQAEADAQTAEAKQREAEAKARQAKAEADAQAATARQKEAEAKARAEAERRAAADAAERRRIDDLARMAKENAAKETETLLAALRDAIAEDNLNSCRERIAELKRRGLTSYQKSVVDLCDQFCDKLERAQNGDSESMMWIALQHAEQKTVVKQDREKAVTWYEKAANSGNSNAMMKLALWSEAGIGCVKDENRSMFWYTKAAKARVGNAMYRLGVFYAQGKMGLEKSKAKAHEMFLNAKRNGCTYTDEKTGVDAWLKATKPQDATSGKRSYFGGSNTGGGDLDSLLNDLEASSSGR